MKKNKGFTLIELLAVIVILAIIMVIAVPKILDVIESSRRNAASASIKLVKDAIKTQLASSNLTSSIFTKDEEGCYEFSFPEENENASNLKVQNKENISGSIKYCNGSFVDDNLVHNGSSGEDLSTGPICKRATTLHTETCDVSGGTRFCGEYYSRGSTITYGSLGTSGTLKSGDAFDCDVNADGKYNSENERFYFITSSSDKAILLYYSNTRLGVPNDTVYDRKYSDKSTNQYGPSSALIGDLPSTKQWKNKKLIINKSRAILSENGGNSISGVSLPTNFNYNSATRLITYQEVRSACGMSSPDSHGYLDNCKYLLERTGFNDGVGGDYLTETPMSSDTGYAYYIGRGNRVMYYTSAGWAGLAARPVIEVLKTDMEY